MFALEKFKEKYATETRSLIVRERQFRFFVPRELDPYLHPEDPLKDFPLWAKPWEASWVLADYLAGMEAASDEHFLEIGAGIGLVGITAACFGHRFTITEYDPHAIQFARANALLNNCKNAEIMELDWHNPSLQTSFDCIVGSEVTYRDEDYAPLHRLLTLFLKPSGKIILCSEVRRTTMTFFKKMQPYFDIKVQKKTLRGKTGEIHVVLGHMTFKDLTDT
jgi:predicted nicotinamide N-methyase